MTSTIRLKIKIKNKIATACVAECEKRGNMKVEELSAYEVLEKREIKDINSLTYLCRHKKTGARVALVSNDDDNKVFYIGFRTTPTDSTGVAHIIEHSVLCGSKDFPVKDPVHDRVGYELLLHLILTFNSSSTLTLKLTSQR